MLRATLNAQCYPNGRPSLISKTHRYVLPQRLNIAFACPKMDIFCPQTVAMAGMVPNSYWRHTQQKKNLSPP